MVVAILILTSPALAFGADKYPVKMTAVFTKGKSEILHKSDEMYHNGDYDCTRGDVNNAPECHTILEWAQMDALAGTPDTVVFTLADGSQVGVHGPTMRKINGFVECHPGTSIIFCDLFFEFLERQQVSMTKTSKYGQIEFISAEEHAAAIEARHRELFGDGNTMTLYVRYKLKGKPKDGFQRIELDKSSCVTDEHGTNQCAGVLEILNPRGSGYMIGDRVAPSITSQDASASH